MADAPKKHRPPGLGANPRDFTILANSVIDQVAEIGQAEALVLLVLVRHADSATRIARPAVRTIAQKTGLSSRTVTRALSRLREAALIEIAEVGGGKRTTRYRITVAAWERQTGVTLEAQRERDAAQRERDATQARTPDTGEALGGHCGAGDRPPLTNEAASRFPGVREPLTQTTGVPDGGGPDVAPDAVGPGIRARGMQGGTGAADPPQRRSDDYSRLVATLRVRTIEQRDQIDSVVAALHQRHVSESAVWLALEGARQQKSAHRWKYFIGALHENVAAEGGSLTEILESVELVAVSVAEEAV